jgi:RNA polymerase sigma-70 factor (ECF subfamily)
LARSSSLPDRNRFAWDRAAQTREKQFDKAQVDVLELGGACDETSERRILDEFLASLSKADRAAMLLYLDNVRSAEAAEILGITEGALRVRMHRIRKRGASRGPAWTCSKLINASV